MFRIQPFLHVRALSQFVSVYKRMTELALKATKQRLTETHKRESGSKNEIFRLDRREILSFLSIGND